MAIQHEYTALCEVARPELGGKWIIIGLFPNGIASQMIPFPLPFLTFFQALRADAPGNYRFTAELRHFDSNDLLAQVQGNIQAGMVGPAIVPVTLPNLQFRHTGTYAWSLRVEGQDPFLTQFQVSILSPSQARAIPGFPGMPNR